MTALEMCHLSLGRSTIYDHYYHFCYYYYFLIYIWSCSDSQVQAQTEAITEEDLRLIQERESSIRQLEVKDENQTSTPARPLTCAASHRLCVFVLTSLTS